jgi:hypothetical protein
MLEFALLPGKGKGMGSRTLALDTILSATLHFAGKWQPALKRNQSRDLLRFVLCRLYDAGRGQLVGTQLTVAQGTLARKLGLSRQWIGILLARLQAAGWIECFAPTLNDGMKGSTVLRVGHQLKRLLVMLGKAKTRKKRALSAANTRWQFSPTYGEKKQILIRQKELTPPGEALLSKLPLLKLWLGRGEEAPSEALASMRQIL